MAALLLLVPKETEGHEGRKEEKKEKEEKKPKNHREGDQR